jgi:hypothetical protein
LLRQNLVRAQEFSQDTNMVEWAKPFVSKVFELCSETEIINFIIGKPQKSVERPLTNPGPKAVSTSPSTSESLQRISDLVSDYQQLNS